MADEHSADFDKQDLYEVLSLLPSYEGQTVMELGANLGYFTDELAKKADKVIALDFSGNIVKKVERNNGCENNVKFMSFDVNSQNLNVPPKSIDLIFSNCLLYHLSDKEVENLVESMVKWLRPGGYAFIRDSCCHQYTDEQLNTDHLYYREQRFYTKVFKECHITEEDGISFELSLVNLTYGEDVNKNKNQHKICWLWKKVESQDDKGFQKFLDTIQYKSSGILRYERIFGPGFVSTGGIETTQEFVEMLDLKPKHKVLDVGCGIGGGDFYMAEKFGAEVVGIDLSINMISIALERAMGHKYNVEFEVTDCTKKTYSDNTFDVIYSRDTILHIQDKPALFRCFYKWLKPGGKVLITDYCKKVGPSSPEFASYIQQRGYDLHDVQAYGQMLKEAGFNEVISEDRTDQFIQVLHKELDLV